MPSQSTKPSSTKKPSVKKSSTKKTKKDTKKVVEEEVVVEEVVDNKELTKEVVVEEDVQEDVQEDVSTVKSKRKQHTRESITADFDQLTEYVSSIVESMRNDKTTQPIAKVKKITSMLRTLKKNALQLAKQKRTRVKREGKANSGFLKEVPVSDEMKKFAGWGESEMHSRVDVTKFICDYIKTNDLQNKDDRRVIEPDKKLRKLLNMDKDTSLKYFEIQKKIMPHFKKTD